MRQFDGSSVIVTGAGAGIGYGIAHAFAAAGARVCLNDLDADLAAAAAAQINAAIGAERVAAEAGDVAEPEYVYGLVDRCAARFGAPTIVVANAGITRYIEFLNCTPAMFDQVVGVNLRGTYFLAQAAAKQMIHTGHPGRILLTASVVGLRAFRNFSVYSLTKAGIIMLAQSLALELGAYGITVNAISPGATLTERTQRDDPRYAENWASVTLNGRVGMVDDIAAAALFLAAPEARHITGQNLIVDGGWTVVGPIPPDHPDKPVGS